jgi:hypothetical protein
MPPATAEQRKWRALAFAFSDRPDNEYDYFVRHINLGDICQSLLSFGVPKEELEQITKEQGMSFIPGSRGYKISRIIINCCLVFFGIFFGFILGSVLAVYFEANSLIFKLAASIILSCFFLYVYHTPAYDERQDIYFIPLFPNPNTKFSEEYQLYNKLKEKYPDQINQILNQTEEA